ncbi:MAG: CRISPR-associated endonuclease Cas6, partial [Bacteroidota bacterium]
LKNEKRSMNTLNILTISFEEEIHAKQLPAFRGAIAQKAGKEASLFHQHEGNKLRYRYPLIQYKTFFRKPSMVCLQDGVEEIHAFFSQPDWSIMLHDKKMELHIHNMKLHQHRLQLFQQYFSYRIPNWLALNQKNWKAYQEMDSLLERIHFLERILLGNILSFAKGVGWHIEGEVKVHILKLGDHYPVSMKGVTLRAFPVTFKTNVSLPLHIGLGGKVSHGFGVVRGMGKEGNAQAINGINQQVKVNKHG